MPVVRLGSGSRGRPVIGEKSEAVLSLPGGDSEIYTLPELFGELELVNGDNKDVDRSFFNWSSCQQNQFSDGTLTLAHITTEVSR